MKARQSSRVIETVSSIMVAPGEVSTCLVDSLLGVVGQVSIDFRADPPGHDVQELETDVDREHIGDERVWPVSESYCGMLFE